jgi:hypothetical protein
LIRSLLQFIFLSLITLLVPAVIFIVVPPVVPDIVPLLTCMLLIPTHLYKTIVLLGKVMKRTRFRETSITSFALTLALVVLPKPVVALTEPKLTESNLLTQSNSSVSSLTISNENTVRIDAAPTTLRTPFRTPTPDPNLRTYRNVPWWLWWLSLPVLGGLLWGLLHRGSSFPLDKAAPAPRRVENDGDLTLNNEPVAQQPSDTSNGETGAQSYRAASFSVNEQSRIVLVPRDFKHAYAYWEITEADRAVAKRQGGRTLVLWVYEASEMNLDILPAHSVQQYQCEEGSQDRHVSIPLSERDYVAEVGYTTADGRWLSIARSLQARISELQPQV